MTRALGLLVVLGLAGCVAYRPIITDPAPLADALARCKGPVVVPVGAVPGRGAAIAAANASALAVDLLGDFQREARERECLAGEGWRPTIVLRPVRVP